MKLLKDNVKATESVIRVRRLRSLSGRVPRLYTSLYPQESKIGIAVGKLRSNSSKEVADFAKDLVKRWKTEVERQKQGGGAAANAPPKLARTPNPSPIILTVPFDTGRMYPFAQR